MEKTTKLGAATRQDNLPNVILEAMAAVAFDVGGISDLMRDGRTGVASVGPFAWCAAGVPRKLSTLLWMEEAKITP